MINSKGKAWRWVVGVCVLGVGSVVLSSFWRSNDPASYDKTDQKVKTTQRQSPQVEVPTPTLQADVKETAEVITTNVAKMDNDTIEDVVTEELLPSERLTVALWALTAKVNADTTELQHPLVGANDEYASLRLEMLDSIARDPLQLDRLLDLFEQDPHSKLGRELAEVLSASGDPKAQVLALDMADNTSMYTHEERGAALMMIAEMDGITPETRDRLLVNIQQETESDLTQFSLMGLKKTRGTAADYANVQSVLQETLNRDDSNVRRHAAYTIGKWATSDEDLAPLRTMAIEETDVNARARVVMSIGISDFKSTENKILLYSVIENDDEPLIRQRAWQALENFQLSDAENADYIALGERIQLDIEAWERAYRAQGE